MTKSSVRKRRGFSLLEVIVATAILGLSLTAIFGSEAGAMRTGMRARHYHVATLLARCKMGEIEEQVLRDGFPAIDDSETDDCCEGAEVDGYTCEWSLTPIVLPDNAATEGAPREGGQARAGDSNEEVASRAMAQVGTAGDFLAGGGDHGGLEAMLLNMAVPVLKPTIEQQVRRARVVVRWEEGERRRTIDIAQFLVNERVPNAEVQDALRGGGNP